MFNNYEYLYLILPVYFMTIVVYHLVLKLLSIARSPEDKRIDGLLRDIKKYISDGRNDIKINSDACMYRILDNLETVGRNVLHADSAAYRMDQYIRENMHEQLNHIEETLNVIKKDIDSKNSIRKSADDFIDEIDKFKAREANPPSYTKGTDIIIGSDLFKDHTDIYKKIDERFPSPSYKKKKRKNSKRNGLCFGTQHST